MHRLPQARTCSKVGFVGMCAEKDLAIGLGLLWLRGRVNSSYLRRRADQLGGSSRRQHRSVVLAEGTTLLPSCATELATELPRFLPLSNA